MAQKQRIMKPWMWAFLIMAIMLVIFNFDPVGDFLTKRFGKNAEHWAVNISLIILIIYSFLAERKNKVG